MSQASSIDSSCLNSGQKNQRIVALDAARGTAICLAIFAHYLFNFHLIQNLPPAYFSIVRAITSIATPTFILLFGSLLEIIYVPRYNSWGPTKTRSRLWNRALVCYAAFYACVLILVMFGYQSPKELIAAIPIMAGGDNGGVYSFYAVLLLVAPFLIRIRIHWGFGAVILLSVLTYLIGSAVPNVQLQDHWFRLNYYTCLFFGRPTNHFYPFSIFHMMVLVVIGMYLGRLILRFSSIQAAKRMVLAGSLVLVAYLVLAYWFEPARAFPIIKDMNYFRLNQHPLYYLFLIPFAFFLMAFFMWRIPKESQESSARFRWLQLVGKRSLFVFFVGNMILLFAEEFYLRFNISSLPFQQILTGAFMIVSLKAYLIWADKKELSTKNGPIN